MYINKGLKNKIKKNKLKLIVKQSGITLVAIIITTIILLTLAGITMSIIGNDKIIKKAKNVADSVEKSSAEEEMSMYLTGLEIVKEEAGDNFRLADYLNSNVGNDGLEEFLNNGDGYAQVSYKGFNYLVNLEDGTFTYIGKRTETVLNKHLNQVLNSNNQDVPGIAMVEAGEIETEDLGWKVLSTNSDGTVNLIANSSTGFEVSISGINGYTNGVKALNEICSKLYGNLEIDGKKVLSARNVNADDFYNIAYNVSIKYKSGKKIEPRINQLDSANNGYSTDQIEDYIDINNTSATQSKNPKMLIANSSPTIISLNRTSKPTINMMSTGNNYWIATRTTYYNWDKGSDGKNPYSEELSNEHFQIAYARTDGAYSSYTMFNTIKNYNTSGTNGGGSCALRPVITVLADCVSDTTQGATVKTDKFYKNRTGADAKGYVKADSIAELIGKDIKSLSKVDSGLPTVETDMTWSKLTDGGYDLQTGTFDTSKYDYYIADDATRLQIRLTGAHAYNNAVLALDTVCNNIYGNITEIKLKNGETKQVKVALARNAKWEDFMDESKLSNFGSLWTTNANDSTAPNKISSIWNSYAPTLFTQYENTDRSKGASNGYSDAKITTYNMNTSGTNSWVETDKKANYAYEKYNSDKKSDDPWLKVIYNHYVGGANRNKSNVNIGTEFWLSSRCTYAHIYSASFYLRCISNKGLFTASSVFNTSAGASSSCRGLRPILQVYK